MSELFECRRCKERKPSEAFYRKSKTRVGIERQCKACRNPGMKAQRAIYGQLHKERPKETVYAWRRDNPEAYKEHYRKSRAKHMKKVLARNQQRQQRIKQATPPWADRRAIVDFYALAKVLSQELGTRLDVDHIIPPKGEKVCGLHVSGNLRLLPQRENQLKHNKFEEGMRS